MFCAEGLEAKYLPDLLDKLPIEYEGAITFMGVKVETPTQILRERSIQTRSRRPKPTIEKVWTARINVNPRPALKTTHAGRFNPKAQDYLRYQDEILSQAKRWGFDPKWIVTSVDFTFLMPLPVDCWTERGITPKGFLMMGQPHEKTPDWENLAKPPQDALVPQDSTISEGRGRKFWSPVRTGAILVRLTHRTIQ
jgi:hypothetical protein